MSRDPIDDAIAATEAPPIQIHRYTVPLPSTGRVCFIELPMDSIPAELMDAAIGILALIRADREREESTKGGLIIAQRMPTQ